MDRRYSLGENGLRAGRFAWCAALLAATQLASAPAPAGALPLLPADRRDQPLAANTAPAAASPSPDAAAAARAARGESLRIFLMTMGPGDQVYERFGHNALWIRDEASGTDVAYNWGVFDFQQEGFYRNFALGRMLYRLEGYDAGATIDLYVRYDRSVWIQELNLTPAQRARVLELVEENLLPENREYLYDYYRDNCSTRIRDLLDRALDGRLRDRTADLPSGTSYRDHSRRLTAPSLITYLGIHFGLGRLTDREISAWDEMFIPMKLQAQLRETTVLDERGNAVPLVLAEDTLFTADRPAERAAPPVWWPWFLGVGLLIGGGLVALGRRAPDRRAARIGLHTAAVVWGLAAGFFGLLLALLWGVTDHWAAYRNENLLQATPLGLVLVAILLAGAAARPWAGAAAAKVAAVMAGMAVLGLVLELLPGAQANAEFLALALPVHAGLALGLRFAAAQTAERDGRAAARTLDLDRVVAEP